MQPVHPTWAFEIPIRLIGVDAAPGQWTFCLSEACIDPIFGPTIPYVYKSASTVFNRADYVWAAAFGGYTQGVPGGSVTTWEKTNEGFVRAVRTGSCTE